MDSSKTLRLTVLIFSIYTHFLSFPAQANQLDPGPKSPSNNTITPFRSDPKIFDNQNLLNEPIVYPPPNLTLNATLDEEDDELEDILKFIYPKKWTWSLIFVHCVVFAVGLVGNCLVCVAVYRNHTMRTVTNYFIVNLAVADFLVILFCLPPSVVWDVTSTWWFGTAMCKIVLYLQISLFRKMNRKFAISEVAVKTHRCSLCSQLLSVPPIMSSDLGQERYKCGRCAQVQCQIYTRITLYEDVAKHLSFPCTYDECNKRIVWDHVVEHERNCLHRTMKCPVYYHNCSEVIRVEKLRQHFQDKHSQNMKTLGQNWSVNVQYDYVFLCEADGSRFLIYILHLDEKFSVAVLSIDHCKYTKFNLQLHPRSASVGNFSIEFKNQPVFRYDERSHCYMCIRKKCNEPHHPYSQKNSKGQMPLSGFVSKLRKELVTNVKSPDGNLCYCVTLIADETVPEALDRGVEESLDVSEQAEGQAQATSIEAGRNQPLVNVEALKKGLSCPYCMTYMAPPIYTCSAGHTICNVCRPRLDKCPTCAATLGDCRNYTLEEMTQEIGVPCQYDVKGCTFMGNASKMYIHELDCSFNNLLRE